ncbi:hypothetical protein KUTeg_022183 [Tegillarca granosa]|uniref:EF-hand domain-containing protein n=1 Tax=Tegillarca granosa TaxID=220873 RepID=A0ABQ9E5H3_TEGGR|nr:hypothetical protein KUTeg_022183 [Tegillarca granosa]
MVITLNSLSAPFPVYNDGQITRYFRVSCNRLIMDYMLIITNVFLFISIYSHPARPSLPDSPEARLIFNAAERNRTPDGFITRDEMQDIFHVFDENGDGLVDQTEMVDIWRSRQLGNTSHALTLFQNIDTDGDSFITEVPDISRTFIYFDRNEDGKISEEEFVIVWTSLSL